MTALLVSWQFWAILSAVFAAMTAIFAKIGVSGIDSDLATWLRTLAIGVILGIMVWAGGKLRGISDISPRAALFLLLSALATGASWLCYFRALSLGDAARVAPIDKLSVVMVAGRSGNGCAFYQAVEKRRRSRQDNTDGGPAKTAEKRSESRSTLRAVNEHFDWARTRGCF